MRHSGLRVERVASENFGNRRNGHVPELVVLHYTAMATDEAALERLCSREHEVSAHYLVGRTGRVYGLVEERKRAWHAGRGMWGGLEDVNSRSIGIEIANPGNEPFPAAQVQSVEALLRSVVESWRIAPERVIAHSDCAVGRKLDPGPKFDWRRLAIQGLAVWPEVGLGEGPCREVFVSDAIRFGYQPEDFFRGSDYFRALLGAVRLRFRPWADGPLDDRDMAIVSDLAKRFPS